MKIENVFSKKVCHSKLDLESSTQVVYEQQQQALKILNRVQDDNMITTKRGFALIELLVVVLIIGILAAVAVPQYQKAVIKSRMVQGIVFAKAVHDAEEAYYLTNGDYTDLFDELDISIECPENFSCSIMHKNRVQINENDSSWVINYSFAHRDDIPELKDKLYCVASKTDTQTQQICAGMGQEVDFGNKNYNYYVLN